jgi:hypothetical protein
MAGSSTPYAYESSGDGVESKLRRQSAKPKMPRTSSGGRAPSALGKSQRGDRWFSPCGTAGNSPRPKLGWVPHPDGTADRNLLRSRNSDNVRMQPSRNQIWKRGSAWIDSWGPSVFLFCFFCRSEVRKSPRHRREPCNYLKLKKDLEPSK